MQIFLILLVFFIVVGLMMARKMPTIVALPIMAVAIGFIAGMPFISSDKNVYTIAKNVLENGAMRLSSAIAGLIFGAFFGRVLNKVGITRTIIRKAGELAGDKPLPIAFAFLAVSSLIFTAATGLGIVILVGTIILPIMISVGIAPIVSGVVLLFSVGIGVTFNIGNFGFYKDVFNLPIETISAYSWICGLPLIIAAILAVSFLVLRDKKVRNAWAMPTMDDPSERNVRSIALISPLIPIFLVFIWSIPLVPAILLGIVAALILSTPQRPIHIVSASMVEGIQDVAGAVGLMVGIGMILQVVLAPQVSAVLQPMITAIAPRSILAYILFFGLLSPLAIYRGPLNLFGLGSGIAALFAAAGINPIALMVALRLDSNVQAVCDPTNSHNVWTSDFTKTDVNDILKKTIIWVFVSTLLGLIISTFFVKL